MRKYENINSEIISKHILNYEITSFLTLISKTYMYDIHILSNGLPGKQVSIIWAELIKVGNNYWIYQKNFRDL